MKKPMRYCLLLCGVALFGSSFKPNDDFSITVRASGVSIKGAKNIYYLNGNNNAITIRQIRVDSLYREIYNNKDYNPLLNGMSQRKLSRLEQSKYDKITDSLTLLYSKHSEKAVTISRSISPLYFKLIDSVLHADSSIVKPRSLEPHRVLDGVWYTVKTKDKSTEKVWQFHSPHPDDFPLIVHFFNQTARLLGTERF